MFHMFDALLMMYVDLPARMNPGVIHVNLYTVHTCIHNSLGHTLDSERCLYIVFYNPQVKQHE